MTQRTPLTIDMTQARRPALIRGGYSNLGDFDGEVRRRAVKARASELQRDRDTAYARGMEADYRAMAASRASSQDPTGGSNKAAITADTVTSAAAMSSDAELQLFRLDGCAKGCPEACTSCRSRWSSLPSLEAEKFHIAEMESGHGIVVRVDPKQDNKTIRVDIQNTYMKDILRDVFEGYPDFHPSLLPGDSAWIFNEPFEMFVGRWGRLSKYEAHLCTLIGQKKAAWVALVEALAPIVQPVLDSIKRIKDTGLVLWKDLPLIFLPGKLIVIEELGVVQSVARVLETSTTPADYSLDYEYIDWDGETHGFNLKSLSIPCYGGHKKVRLSDLKTIPLEFCPLEEELRAKLIARGRRWSSLNAIEYKQLGGKKVPVRTGVPVEANGRIVIDAAAFFDKIPNGRPFCRPELEPLEEEAEVEDGVSEVSVRLSDEKCLLASGIARGFDFKTKDWCLFPVDGISDITFNTDAYDKLVLPPSEKKLAWAFVESKNRLLDASRSDESIVFDDFVAEKGKGLVMLLCGPPGVGKTYTAEAIAEMAKVPLYMMSAGELGSVSKDVEAALDDVLGLCRRWKAMLLLDEADVFLGKRLSGGRESIERNELVSIFLRRLEYYQGTMFLTTNKIENIDDAFQSRIDIILPYGDLNAEARLQVWVNFINKSGGTKSFDLTEQQVQQLAQVYHLNGREIKNLVKSSLLVAGKFGGPGVSTAPSDGGSQTGDTDAATEDSGQAKVTMAILETLAAMRIRAHKLMGKTQDDDVAGL